MTAGAVLCGGASRRMGTDKALVEVDGVPMAERVAGALEAAGCSPVVFVGGDGPLLARFGRPTLPDEWPGEGPLGGVVTAMRAIGDDVVVAACDLPWLDAATVTKLIAVGATTSGVEVAVASTDRLHPALAWWSHTGLGAVLTCWERGTRALHKAIERVSSVHVAVEPRALRNVNTRADLEEPGE